MKKHRLAFVVLALWSLGAGALSAQQFVIGTQSVFATPPGVANTFGNDIAVLNNTVGAPAIVAVNDAAWHQNGGAAAGLNWGQALFYNFNSAPLTAPLKTSPGSARTDFMAWDMESVGDVDGDGWDDLAVGAPQVGAGTGYVRVISGNPAVMSPFDVIYQVGGAAGSSFFGGGLDRINIGLGGRDLLVASIGSVEVRDELSGALLAGPVNLPAGFSIVRSLKYFTERFSVRTIGDVNFDLLDDFAVGSAGSDQVLILDGNPATFGATIATINSPVANSLFGYAIAPMGDLTGDGAAEFLIGAPGDSGNQGMVYLFDGATFTVLGQFSGNNPNEFFGFSADGNFDLNADGTTDAIVGAPGDVFTAVGGYAQTLSGIALSPLYGATTTPAAPPGLAGPVYGTNVAGVGDLNGDSFPDYAVGLPQDSAAVGGTGHNFVYVGGPLASVTAIGNGCSSDGTPPPTLILGGSPAIGSSITPVVIDTFHPTTAGALFIGTPGTLPPCFDLTNAVTAANFNLAGGIAFLPPIPVPASPALLGAVFRFQAAVLVPGGFNVSNSFEVVVGLQ